jgi:serine/threonine-protein kinase
MSSALELSEGHVFAGQFRVVKPLAQGGMGAVYVVEQLSTGKKRALKLMLPSAAVVDGTRRFEQEARTSSLIPSEHVVDVIAAGLEGPERIPWLAMELLEGDSLEAYLDEVGALSPNQAYEVLSQLAHALTAAHDLGVVHRDLKPDNIFLAHSRTSNSEFMVKVLDFGLATVLEPSSKNTTALGSPLWMAPEQTQTNAPISLGTDVWAIGLIVFRMLSGRHYWRTTDGSLATLLREIVIDPLPPASQRSGEVGGAALPEGFDQWFAQCVVRFPAYRFEHARDAWQALHTVLLNAGATPHAPRSFRDRARTTTPPPRASQPALESSASATALSASRTLLSPSDPELAPGAIPDVRSVTPQRRAPAPSGDATGRVLVFLLLLTVGLGASAAYWLKSIRRVREATPAFADAPSVPSHAGASSRRSVPPPSITPASATASTSASVIASSASAAPLSANAAASASAPSKAAAGARPSKALSSKLTAPSKAPPSNTTSDKPPATLPDLL